jgi:protein gp37
MHMPPTASHDLTQALSNAEKGSRHPEAGSLVKYDAACRALAEARSVDQIKDIRDQAVAMAAYARQAKNHDLEADAIEIRLRATRKLDQLRQAQKATVGLATGGDARRVARGKQSPEHKPTLAVAGIDKDLAKEGRKLGALSEQDFEQKVAETREAVKSAIGRVIKSITLPSEATETAETEANEITLAQWKAMSAAERCECLKPENFPSDVKFNKQDSDRIDWAQYSWNPVTGCKHPCQIYCWAKDVALRHPELFKHGFDPVFRPRRLNAPRNTPVPPEAAFDGRFKNVFTVSMGDLFGGWIPREWIEAVLATARDNPQWNFLFLTKFPNRIADFEIPSNAWMGTTVDLQARVANAEAAFAELRAKNKDAILWLSCEPLLEPIRFNQLDLFNWIVIGGAARSMRTPEFRPPERWIDNLVAAADKVGCKIFEKTNLHGNRILELPFDAPIKTDYPQVAPDVFHYLKKAAP